MYMSSQQMNDFGYQYRDLHIPRVFVAHDDGMYVSTRCVQGCLGARVYMNVYIMGGPAVYIRTMHASQYAASQYLCMCAEHDLCMHRDGH